METTTCPNCGAEVKAKSIGRLQRAMEQHYTDRHGWKKGR